MDLSRLQKAAENFLEFFKGAYVVHAIELVLAFMLFYYVIRVLVDNNAKKLIWFYSLLLVLGSVLIIFSGGISLDLYLIFIMLLTMFFLLMFDLEIKRSVWKTKRKAVPKNNFAAEGKTTVETEACISAIIRSLQNMSKRDTGALIILSNDNLPKQVLDSGVSLNADISSQLIEGIFINKAPLHDGAMIIAGHKIKAAGCFLPMSQNTSLPKDLGSRHRAAVGITEVTDVVTFVVSEETGIISVVKKGVLTRYADYNMLRNVLIDYYWSDFKTEGKADGKKAKEGE